VRIDHLKRREFITLLGGAAAWPFAAHAQQPTLVIGWLSGGFASSLDYRAAFHDGLKSFGYVVDQNVTIEYRWAEGQYERLPALAADLVARKVSVIVASGNAATALAARAATTTIPIVFSIGHDPVRSGLVASLDRPGGNITGVTQLAYALGEKRLLMLHELAPKARALAILSKTKTVDPGWAENHGAKIGVRLVRVAVSTESELEPVIASLSEKQVDGLFVDPDPFLVAKRESLVVSLTRHKMPAVFFDKESVVAGGLLSHGASIVDAYRLLGTYVGRILKGEKPANLPVAEPKIDLVINLKTAKAFGLAIPKSLLEKATELIE
jgi:putative ABC transport system substrate-binding protein